MLRPFGLKAAALDSLTTWILSFFRTGLDVTLVLYSPTDKLKIPKPQNNSVISGDVHSIHHKTFTTRLKDLQSNTFVQIQQLTGSTEIANMWTIPMSNKNHFKSINCPRQNEK